MKSVCENLQFDIFAAFFNPFNSAISTNTTEDGSTILIFTYPKNIKKYTLGVSKEAVSENNIDFGSILRGLMTKLSSKFKGLFSGSAGGLFSSSSFGGGSSTESPDSEFEFTDDNNSDNGGISSNTDNPEDDFDSSSEDTEEISEPSSQGYFYPTRSESSTTVLQSYLPPPTPSLFYELPKEDEPSDFF